MDTTEKEREYEVKVSRMRSVVFEDNTTLFTEASSAEEAEALVLRLADEYGSDVSWVSEEVDEETDSAEVVGIRAVEMEEEREVREAHKEHERVLEQWFEEIMRKKVGLGEAEIVGADPITGKTQYRILRGKGWTR